VFILVTDSVWGRDGRDRIFVGFVTPIGSGVAPIGFQLMSQGRSYGAVSLICDFLVLCVCRLWLSSPSGRCGGPTFLLCSFLVRFSSHALGFCEGLGAGPGGCMGNLAGAGVVCAANSAWMMVGAPPVQLWQVSTSVDIIPSTLDHERDPTGGSTVDLTKPIAFIFWPSSAIEHYEVPGFIHLRYVGSQEAPTPRGPPQMATSRWPCWPNFAKKRLDLAWFGFTRRSHLILSQFRYVPYLFK